MNGGASQRSRTDASVAADIAGDPFRWARNASPYSCGGCGARFSTKGEKRRHKAECGKALPDLPGSDDAFCDDADLYTRERHVTPEIKARADAEWAAMDWRGRLPDGWEYRPALLDARGGGR